MENKQDISQYRWRMDKTLATHDLANKETLKPLVKKQMLQSTSCEVEECTDNVIEKRTNEVSNFLEMLRSASADDDDHGSKTKETSHRGWKVKQDTKEFRVMYREGPQGTPFHTLLVEGYVDGPVDVCLCISWESPLYKKWWPQTVIPTFKILASECLQRVRIGEQISLARMKVSWPLSTREAVIHFFEFEYFQDDLVVVLMNSVSDLESIDKSTHGFTKEGIPDVKDVVRIDVVGGFAIQKVNAGRSYFRTIANMDIKLDLVPPSFINFISRQLIGSGFRLYQKEVASVAKGDEDFGEVLRGPLYTRIRKALFSDNNQNMSMDPENCNKESLILPLEHAVEPVTVEEENTDRKAFCDDIDHKGCCEIEEIEEEEIKNSGLLELDHKEINRQTKSEISESCVKYRKKGDISVEVKHALQTLEEVISVIRDRKYGFAPKRSSPQGLGNEQLRGFGESAAIKDTKTLVDAHSFLNGGMVCVEVSENNAASRNHNEPRDNCGTFGSRCAETNSYSTEVNPSAFSSSEGKGFSDFQEVAYHKKIVPASAEEDIHNASERQKTNKGKKKWRMLCC